MKKSFNIFNIIFLLIVLIICANFTNGAKKDSDAKAIEFVALLEGESIINATLYDEANIIPLREISFTGHTTLASIPQESNDSRNTVDLAKIKSLEVINESYVSPHHQDKEYILVKIVSKTGAEINDLLIPREVVICGISKETDMEKSWYLRKIKKIEIITPEVKTEEPKTVAKPEVVVKKRNK